ncbi:MAG TPA: metallophosphoesterase, partial [Ruminiclostridium sp.]|nr:metallophosphoesterase [Ruminiclostridium sp.]
LINSEREVQKKKTKRKLIFCYFAVSAVMIAGLIYFSINIEVSRYTVESNRLPQDFDRFKILQISDFHNGTFYGGAEALIKKVKGEKPDIIVNTGDIIDETSDNSSKVIKLAEELVSIAPVYSVTGNHDKWFNGFDFMQKTLRNKGITLLENRETTVSRGKSLIRIFGISDPDAANGMGPIKYVRSQMSGLTPGYGYNILLFHRANMFDSISGRGYQLILSGHMHGGQVQIPFVGGLIAPQRDRRWFPKYTDGKWKANGTTMIVSRGLGNIVAVPRLLNPPQIVTVTLKKK